MLDPRGISMLVKTTAASLGFDACGIAKARHLSEDEKRLEDWLHKGMNGKMHYMENYFDLRVDPTKLLPGARSVITLLFNYFPEVKQENQAQKISKYAYGADYHDVIRKKLNSFLAQLKAKVGDFAGRGFVDSAPVLERAWALQSGLGWVGKNGNLLTKTQGSFFFIATLVTDLDITADAPYALDLCGTCTKCIDACPTQAILPEKIINGSKCISYFTIELKDALIPGEMKDKFDHWMFGCDTCQDVCPWNRFSRPHNHAELAPIAAILQLDEKGWDELTEEQFKIIFKDSPIKRSKFSGIKRNLQFLKDESAD